MSRISKGDIGLVAISLLIALALWINVSVNRQETIAEKQIFGINLHVMGLSDQFDLEYKPEKVDILLQGSPSALSKVTPEDVRLTIDLTGYTEGRWVVTPKGTVSDPLKAQIVKTTPDKIEVVLKTKSPKTQYSVKSTEQEGKN